MKKKLSFRWLIAAIIILVGAYSIVFSNPFMKTLEKSSDLTMFDMRLGVSSNDAQTYLEDLGAVGRKAYTLFSLLIDMLFPVAYSFSLFTGLLFLKQRLTSVNNFFQTIIFLPFVGALFDILENISILILISRFPYLPQPALILLNIFTPLKWFTLCLSGILFLSLSIILLVKRTGRE